MVTTWLEGTSSCCLAPRPSVDVLSMRQKAGAFALLSLLGACRQTRPAAEAPTVPETKTYVFKHDGIVRDVQIFDPASETGDSRPLVVVLHGGLGDDDDTGRLSFAKLNQLAADELVQKRQADPSAVFFVGVSDGAMMAHRFACERTAKLRAFAAVIGAMPYNVARRSSRCGKEPLSVLMINGTEDPIVPWEGGVVQFDEQKLGRVLSPERTFSFWMRHDGCEHVEVSMIPDFVPSDGTRIERRKATGCRSGTKVELFAVQGAGHTWPSGWQYLPKSMVGTISKDIDAAVAAWRFFQSTL